MSTEPQAAPASEPGPHAEPDDKEEIYFQGSPPVRAFAGKVCLYGLIGVAILALAILLVHKHIGPWWLWVGADFAGADFAVGAVAAGQAGEVSDHELSDRLRTGAADDDH